MLYAGCKTPTGFQRRQDSAVLVGFGVSGEHDEALAERVVGETLFGVLLSRIASVFF